MSEPIDFPITSTGGGQELTDALARSKSALVDVQSAMSSMEKVATTGASNTKRAYNDAFQGILGIANKFTGGLGSQFYDVYKVIGGATIALGEFQTAEEAAAAASTALDVALGPVGIGMAALAVVAGAVYYAYENSTQAIKDQAQALKDLAEVRKTIAENQDTVEEANQASLREGLDENRKKKKQEADDWAAAEKKKEAASEEAFRSISDTWTQMAEGYQKWSDVDDERALQDQENTEKVAADAAARTAAIWDATVAQGEAVQLSVEDVRQAELVKQAAARATVTATLDAVQSELDAYLGYFDAVSAAASRVLSADIGRIDKRRKHEKAAVDARVKEELHAEGVTDEAAVKHAEHEAEAHNRKLKQLKAREKAERETAMEVWRVTHDLDLAVAVVDAAMGIGKAAASAPPPYDVPAIIQATATGAANIAAVAAAPAPSFHDGGMAGDPDETMTRTLRGEARLNTRVTAELGPDSVAALNQYGLAGLGMPATRPRYKHHDLNIMLDDNMGTNGPLARRMRRGDRVGQRRRGRGR